MFPITAKFQDEADKQPSYLQVIGLEPRIWRSVPEIAAWHAENCSVLSFAPNSGHQTTKWLPVRVSDIFKILSAAGSSGCADLTMKSLRAQSLVNDSPPDDGMSVRPRMG